MFDLIVYLLQSSTNSETKERFSKKLKWNFALIFLKKPCLTAHFHHALNMISIFSLRNLWLLLATKSEHLIGRITSHDYNTFYCSYITLLVVKFNEWKYFRVDSPRIWRRCLHPFRMGHVIANSLLCHLRNNKVIVSVAAGNIHSNTIWPYRVRHYTRTLVRNQFNQFTSDWSRPLLHNTTRTFLACDPVIDVALDKEFLTDAAP